MSKSINILLGISRYTLLFMVISSIFGLVWMSAYYSEGELWAFAGGIGAASLLFWSSSPARLAEGNLFLITVLVILFLYSMLIQWTVGADWAGRVLLMVELLAFSFTVWAKAKALQST